MRLFALLLVLYTAACSPSSPVAAQVSLGADRQVEGGEWIVITGQTANGNFLQRRWTQLSGPQVPTLGDGTNTLAFAAPQVEASLLFELALVQGLSVIARDVVRIHVDPTRRGGSGTALSRIEVQGAGSSAFHEATERLFVAGESDVAVWDLSDPAAPIELPPLDVGATSSGVPVDLALNGDELVVLLSREGAAGALQVWDAGGTAFLDQVALAEGPLKIVAGESTFLVACWTGVVHHVTVNPLAVESFDFTPFDGQEEALRAAGVHLPNGESASGGLVPSSVVFDGTHAGWALCQRNNAWARIDLVQGVITEVQAMPAKDWSDPSLARSSSVAVHRFPDAVIGNTVAGQAVSDGGYAGLTFTSEADGQLNFLTTSGPGPVLDVSGGERPFLFPNRQLRVVQLALDPALGSIEREALNLWRADGITPITGRPNSVDDVTPVDAFAAPLALDPEGLDPRSVIELPDGSFWIADDYRPSVAHFDADGVLIARYVPTGDAAFGTETLPEVYRSRRPGHGFSGLTYDPARDRVQAWLHGSLGVESRLARVIELDPASGALTAEFLYVLGSASRGVQDAVWSGSSGEFLTLEASQLTGIDAAVLIHKVRFEGATNLLELPDYDGVAGLGGTLEGAEPSALQALGITPLQSSLETDLASAGVTTFEELGGLCLLDDGRMALLADDGHGLRGASLDTATGRFTPHPVRTHPSGLLLVESRAAGFDASDRDEAITIEPWPVRSLRQPRFLAAFEGAGQSFLVTADGGSPRPGEATRVGELVLDVSAFPNANELQDEGALGRLEVSKELGDTDGDGDYDELWSFGGRGFSVWSAEGELLFDAADSLARELESSNPSFFNSEGTEETFDISSPERGSEPEALCIGEVNGRAFLFVALLRLGVVAVYDMGDPQAPKFATLIGSPGDSVPQAVTLLGDTNLLAVTFAGTEAVVLFELEL